MSPAPKTPLEKLRYALKHRDPICKCGDAKSQHENGEGKCRVCGLFELPLKAAA